MSGAQQPDDTLVDQLGAFDSRDRVVALGDTRDRGEERADEAPTGLLVARLRGDDELAGLLERERGAARGVDLDGERLSPSTRRRARVGNRSVRGERLPGFTVIPGRPVPEMACRVRTRGEPGATRSRPR